MGAIVEQMVCEKTGTRGLLFEEPGFCAVLRAPHVDDAVASFIIGTVYERARARFEGAPVHCALHWLAMEGYDSSARKVMTSWAVGSRQNFSRITVAISKDKPLVSMGIAVAFQAMRFAGFHEYQIVHDEEALLARLGLSALE